MLLVVKLLAPHNSQVGPSNIIFSFWPLLVKISSEEGFFLEVASAVRGSDLLTTCHCQNKDFPFTFTSPFGQRLTKGSLIFDGKESWFVHRHSPSHHLRMLDKRSVRRTAAYNEDVSLAIVGQLLSMDKPSSDSDQ
uniref:Uncharacterized protein n=1 Tax=Megaselia scalaris TaxID=36166 RepID=T1H3S2_MEGSC